MSRPGKSVGGRVYLHRSAIKFRPDLEPLIRRAQRLLGRRVAWDVARVDPGRGEVAFVSSPDFDIAPEPTVGPAVVVDLVTGDVREWDQPGLIYHHKHLFVAPDYDGFDIEASARRSERWERLDVDKSRIGRRDYWEREVLPKLNPGRRRVTRDLAERIRASERELIRKCGRSEVCFDAMGMGEILELEAELGTILTPEEGVYVGPGYEYGKAHPDPPGYWHWWLRGRDGTVVDLATTQFGVEPPIVIEPDDERQDHYWPDTGGNEVGGGYLPVAPSKWSKTRRHNPPRVDPSLTAITRGGPSVPVRQIEATGLLRGKRILDFGCGKGEDAAWLRRRGYDVTCYDPGSEEFARLPNGTFDVVMALYVVNVIPGETERRRAVRRAWGLLRTDGLLFLASRSEGEVERAAASGNFERCYDGWCSSRGTFQRGLDRDTLEQLVCELPGAYVMRHQFTPGSTLVAWKAT